MGKAIKMLILPAVAGLLFSTAIVANAVGPDDGDFGGSAPESDPNQLSLTADPGVSPRADEDGIEINLAGASWTFDPAGNARVSIPYTIALPEGANKREIRDGSTATGAELIDIDMNKTTGSGTVTLGLPMESQGNAVQVTLAVKSKVNTSSAIRTNTQTFTLDVPRRSELGDAKTCAEYKINLEMYSQQLTDAPDLVKHASQIGDVHLQTDAGDEWQPSVKEGFLAGNDQLSWRIWLSWNQPLTLGTSVTLEHLDPGFGVSGVQANGEKADQVWGFEKIAPYQVELSEDSEGNCAVAFSKPVFKTKTAQLIDPASGFPLWVDSDSKHSDRADGYTTFNTGVPAMGEMVDYDHYDLEPLEPGALYESDAYAWEQGKDWSGQGEDPWKLVIGVPVDGIGKAPKVSNLVTTVTQGTPVMKIDSDTGKSIAGGQFALLSQVNICSQYNWGHTIGFESDWDTEGCQPNTAGAPGTELALRGRTYYRPNALVAGKDQFVSASQPGTTPARALVDEATGAPLGIDAAFPYRGIDWAFPEAAELGQDPYVYPQNKAGFFIEDTDWPFYPWEEQTFAAIRQVPELNYRITVDDNGASGYYVQPTQLLQSYHDQPEMRTLSEDFNAAFNAQGVYWVGDMAMPMAKSFAYDTADLGSATLSTEYGKGQYLGWNPEDPRNGTINGEPRYRQWLQEVKPPKGYLVADDPFPITSFIGATVTEGVNAGLNLADAPEMAEFVEAEGINVLPTAEYGTYTNGSPYIGLVNNPDYFGVQIAKVDENGEPLTGAEFTLSKRVRDADSSFEVVPGTHDATSNLFEWSNLYKADPDYADGMGREFEYQLQETKVPEGRIKMEDINFFFTYDDATNTPNGLSVSQGGVTLVEGVDYLWNSETGEFSLEAVNLPGVNPPPVTPPTATTPGQPEPPEPGTETLAVTGTGALPIVALAALSLLFGFALRMAAMRRRK